MEKEHLKKQLAGLQRELDALLERLVINGVITYTQKKIIEKAKEGKEEVYEEKPM